MKKHVVCAALICALAPVLAGAGAGQAEWQKDPDGRDLRTVHIGLGWWLPPTRTENRVGGLCFSVGHVKGKNELPRIRKITHGNVQPFKYENIWSAGREAEMDLDLGCAGPAGSRAGSCIMTEVKADWAHRRLEYVCETAGGKAEFELVVSRLLPAVLLRSTTAGIMFLKDAERLTARFAAMPTAGGVKVLDMQSEMIDTGEMTRPWLLVWLDTDWPLDCKYSVWSAKYKANYPLLFVFPEAPDAVEKSDCLAVTCAEPMAVNDEDKWRGHAVMMPLFGDAFPPQSEVELWRRNGLPEKIAERCEWWCNALGRFPLTATESYEGYDAGGDTIRIRHTFEFLPFRPDGVNCFAPLPPMLALARETGFPLEIEPNTVVNTELLTYAGPVAGVPDAESYTFTIGGMGKYVFERRVASDLARCPSDLSAKLNAEIDGMLQSGHLAPWCPFSRDGQTGRFKENTAGLPYQLIWGKPGDTLECLLGALPFLPAAKREAVIAYARKERREFPPERVAEMPFDQGARRERYFVSPALVDLVVGRQRAGYNFHLAKKCMPIESLYALAEYYENLPEELEELQTEWKTIEAIPEYFLSHSDWATLGWQWIGVGWSGGGVPPGFHLFHGGCLSERYQQFQYNDAWYGLGGVLDANCWLKGMIGYTRLNAMLGRRNDEAWGLLGKAFAFRYALAKYNLFLCGRGILPDPAKTPLGEKHTPPTHYMSWDWYRKNPLFVWEMKDPLDYIQQVCVLNEFAVMAENRLGAHELAPALREVSPEIGRFFHDRLRPELARWTEHVETNMPDWFTAFSELVTGSDGRNFFLPVDAHQVFLAKAWVCDEKPDKLRHYCDVPWVAAGDLYYINKLRETLYAYAGWEWKRIEPGR